MAIRALATAAIMTLVPLPLSGTLPSRSHTVDQLAPVAVIRGHLNDLQRIADQHDGNRASGTSGYDASVHYVVSRLRRAGYQPRLQRFDFNYFGMLAPPVLRQDAPLDRTYDLGDYLVFDGSGSGSVNAHVTATATSCPSGPLPGFPPGDIALIQQPAGCSTATLVSSAEQAGASAVLIYRQAPAPGGGSAGELPQPRGFALPVLGISSPTVAGELKAAATAGALRMHVETRTVSEVRSSVNVLADTRRDRDPQDHTVVLAGAHLDSVGAGPGINDNGSSAATLLTIAERLPRAGRTTNTVRFAFWGAEEPGFLGSTYYVDQLTPAQRGDIVLDLNFEMLGSPNGVRFVMDGDNSQFPAGPGVVTGPPGSGAIEAVFADYFAAQHLPVDRVGLLSRSDHVPFALAGVPVGGLFNGAEGIKTPEQATVYGGTAGAPYDACYHKSCDTVDNLEMRTLSQQADAAAYAIAHFAHDLSEVAGSDR
jgi:hypothetical protein